MTYSKMNQQYLKKVFFDIQEQLAKIFAYRKWQLRRKARRRKPFEYDLPLLIHGIGLKDKKDFSKLTPQSIFEHYIECQKLCLNREYECAATWASNVLGISQNAVYFYGGRPFPGLSNPVFFLVSIDDLVKCNIWGNAVPFDTGSLKEKSVRKIGFGGRRWHYLQYKVELSDLKKYFSYYLSVCFDKPCDYIAGVPNKEISFLESPKYDDLYSVDWRNWTVEVHADSVPLSSVNQLVVNKSFFDFLKNDFTNEAQVIQRYLTNLKKLGGLKVCEFDDAEGYIENTTRERLDHDHA